MGFVVAMAGEIGTALYERPHHVHQTTDEWLIVARWGTDGEYLSLARTGVEWDADAAAPIGLSPSVTCVGMLMSPVDGSIDHTFLLIRQLPPGISVAGSFAPADGFIRLRGPVEALHLTASARHSGVDETQAWCDSLSVALPPAANAGACHITASRKPWGGEFVEPRAMTISGSGKVGD